MANTITAVRPVVYEAARAVPRELTGFLGAVRRDFDGRGMALNDTVKVPVMPSVTAATVTPAQTFTVGSDRTPTTKSVALTNFRQVSWNLTAEEDRSLQNAGVAQDLFGQTVQQALRTLVNEMEVHVAGIAKAGSSRAVGTAGTTPFATTLTAAAEVHQVLRDNGITPNSADVSLVINTAAGLKLRALTQLQKALEAGTTDTLRRGVLLDLFGMGIRESAGIALHTKGAGTGYDVVAAGEAIGQTTLSLEGGTVNTTGIKAGDIAAFDTDTANKYVVNTGLTATSGDIVIGDPGLRVAAVDASELTIGDNYTPNIALHRNAMVLVARPALQPDGAIAEQMTVTDPETGLSFLLLRVPGDSLVSWYLRVVYEATVINPFMIATLMG